MQNNNNVKLNLNINKEDTNSNDYLYCWEIFKKRPNKLTLYNAYNSATFLKILSKYIKEYNGVNTDVIPTGQDYIINQKTLVNVEKESAYISFTQYDKLLENSAISDVIIYYKDIKSKLVDKLVSEFEECIIDYRDENTEDRINNLTVTQNGLELDNLELLEIDYENIDYYYNTETIKEANKITKKIKKSEKGLSIIYGDRGTGKTSLVNYIISNIDKLVIYVPSNLIETIVNNPEFKNFMKRNRNSVLIIDDCETYFDNRGIKSDTYSSNLLQMIDGFFFFFIKVNIIMVFNLDNDEYIPDTLLDCNNLHNVINTENLNTIKCNELSKYLGVNIKYKDTSKLIDVINGKFSKNKSTIGYK